jgi:hypothetical protein
MKGSTGFKHNHPGHHPLINLSYSSFLCFGFFLPFHLNGSLPAANLTRLLFTRQDIKPAGANFNIVSIGVLSMNGKEKTENPSPEGSFPNDPTIRKSIRKIPHPPKKRTGKFLSKMRAN